MESIQSVEVAPIGSRAGVCAGSGGSGVKLFYVASTVKGPAVGELQGLNDQDSGADGRPRVAVCRSGGRCAQTADPGRAGKNDDRIRHRLFDAFRTASIYLHLSRRA